MYFVYLYFVLYFLYVIYVGFYVGVLYFYLGYWGLYYGFGYFMGYVFSKFKVEKGLRKGKFDISKEWKIVILSYLEENLSNRIRRDIKEFEMYEKSEV